MIQQLLLAIARGSNDFPGLRKKLIAALMELGADVPSIYVPRGLCLLIAYYAY